MFCFRNFNLGILDLLRYNTLSLFCQTGYRLLQIPCFIPGISYLFLNALLCPCNFFFRFCFQSVPKAPGFLRGRFLARRFFLTRRFLSRLFRILLRCRFLGRLARRLGSFLIRLLRACLLGFFLIASRVVAVYWVVFGIDIAVLAQWVCQVAFVGILTGEVSCFRAVMALTQVLQAHFFYVFLFIIPP